MIDLIRRLNAKTWPYTTFLLLCFVTYASLFPLPELDGRWFRHADKVKHMMAYAALALPVALARPRLAWALSVVFVMWSGVMELLQPYAHRHRDLLDLIANTIGLGSGLISAHILRAIAHRWERRRAAAIHAAHVQPAGE